MYQGNEELIAAVAGALGFLMMIALVWVIIMIVALWKIFNKFGEPGWKALIPYYNGYIMFKYIWNPTMFWVVLIGIIVSFVLSMMGGALAVLGSLISLALWVIGIIQAHKLSKCFGHGVLFTLGLIFLNPIFLLILGFGDDQYLGVQ